MSEQSAQQAAAEPASHQLPSAVTEPSAEAADLPIASTASGQGAAEEVESLGTALQRVANLGRE